jgi:hypothetical protein
MRRAAIANERFLEVLLVLITMALACVLYAAGHMQLAILNLFFLPVVLAGFYLGRYRAGVLALFSVVVASIVLTLDMSAIYNPASPLLIALAVILWGAVLGLAALLVGTLCDECVAKAMETHEAHVGVIEVLARYLQCANPNLESRANRVAELSEQVARHMRLSAKEIDDIRIAAMLIDMENIEITARVIRKAVGELQEANVQQRTFHGTELVRSLGSVLTGAFPLLLNQSETATAEPDEPQIPFGARIIRTVRAYALQESDPWDTQAIGPAQIIADLRSDADAHHPAVLHALESVVKSTGEPVGELAGAAT